MFTVCTVPPCVSSTFFLLLNSEVEQELMGFLAHSCEDLKLVVEYAFIFEVLNIS